MFREDRFVMSHRPYAVDLSSLHGATETVPPAGRTIYRGRITAVWYRRRNGVTVSCVGELWDYQDAEPADARQFVERYTDGRYGGDCKGRWDGQRYWGAQEPDVMERHLTLLRPMLAAYPTVMPGFDGWWKF